MRTPRADSVVEMDQLERRFDHLGRGAAVTDFAAIVRECDRVVALLPAGDRSWARERIEQLRARLLLHRSPHQADCSLGHGATRDPSERVASENGGSMP